MKKINYIVFIVFFQLFGHYSLSQWLTGAISNTLSKSNKKGAKKTPNTLQLGQIADTYTNLLEFNPVISQSDTASEGYPLEVLGVVNSNYFAYFDQSFFTSKIRLVKYDSSLKKVASVFIFEGKENDPQESNFEEIVTFGNQLYIFTTQYTKEANGSYSQKLYAEFINSNILKKEEKKLISTKSTLSKVKNIYFFKLSPDSSQLAIINFNDTETKNLITGNIKVVNTQFDIIWESSLELPYSFSNFDTDVKGVELKMKLEKDASFNILTPDNNFYRYTALNKEKKITISGTSEKVFNGVQFYSTGKQIVFTGLFSNKNNTDSVQGSFYYRYNISADSFDITRLEKDSLISDDTFFVNNLITTEDAGSILLLKKEVVDKYPQKGASPYLYQDVVVLKRNLQGNTEWEIKVPSSEYRDNNDLMSFYNNRMLYITFNTKDNTYLTAITDNGKVVQSKAIWYNKFYQLSFDKSGGQHGKIVFYANKVSNSPVKIYAFVRIL